MLFLLLTTLYSDPKPVNGLKLNASIMLIVLSVMEKYLVFKLNVAV